MSENKAQDQQERVRYSVESVPVDRDWIAQELGYESYADLDAQAEAERSKLSPEARAAANEMACDIERQMFGGQ
jgi:hypothetical protein